MQTIAQKIDLKNLDKSNWETFRFEEIASKISETVDPNSTTLDTYVGLEHLDAEDIHIRRKGTPDDVSGGKLKCYPGDVIFGKRRAYQRKAAIVDFEGICSAHVFVFRVYPEVIEPKLFPFFMHSDQFMHRMVDISVGGLSPTINWGDLKHQEFLLPPKDQQVQLAELLWAMDEVIEREREVLERLDKAMKSSIKYHFSNANNVIRIKDLGKVITGATPPTNNVNYWQGGITPFITPSEIDDSIYVNKTERFLTESGVAKSRLFKANSVLTVCIGSTIGKIAINEIESCSNQQINAIIPQDGYSAIYILHLLRYHKSKILARSGATAVPIINKTEFESIKLPILQKSKIPIFENEVIGFSKSIKLMESKINSSQTLQKSLINQIF